MMVDGSMIKSPSKNGPLVWWFWRSGFEPQKHLNHMLPCLHIWLSKLPRHDFLRIQLTLLNKEALTIQAWLIISFVRSNLKVFVFLKTTIWIIRDSDRVDHSYCCAMNNSLTKPPLQGRCCKLNALRWRSAARDGDVSMVYSQSWLQPIMATAFLVQWWYNTQFLKNTIKTCGHQGSPMAFEPSSHPSLAEQSVSKYFPTTKTGFKKSDENWFRW